jgi:hypothetical protein
LLQFLGGWLVWIALQNQTPFGFLKRADFSALAVGAEQDF